MRTHLNLDRLGIPLKLGSFGNRFLPARNVPTNLTGWIKAGRSSPLSKFHTLSQLFVVYSHILILFFSPRQSCKVKGPIGLELRLKL